MQFIPQRFCSGKKEYSQVMADSWSIADGKKDMKDRLSSYGAGECPENLKEMAYNTAMIVNSLISNSPVRTSQNISNIPVFYSSLIVMTQDSY